MQSAKVNRNPFYGIGCLGKEFDWVDDFGQIGNKGSHYQFLFSMELLAYLHGKWVVVVCGKSFGMQIMKSLSTFYINFKHDCTDNCGHGILLSVVIYLFNKRHLPDRWLDSFLGIGLLD